MSLALLLAAAIWEPAHPARLEPVLRKAVEARATDAAAMGEFGRYLLSVGRRDEGAEWLRKAVSTEARPSDLETLAGLNPPDGIELLRESVKLRSSAGGEPLARTWVALGSALEARGQAKEAESAYRSAITAAERPGTEKQSSAALGVACNDLGLLLEGRDDMAGAEKLYRRALAVHEKVSGPRHPETATTLNNLAGSVGAQGRLAEAEPLLRRAVSIFEASLGPTHSLTAAALANLGDLVTARGRAAEARPLYQRAISAYERLGDGRTAAEVRQRSAR